MRHTVLFITAVLSMILISQPLTAEAAPTMWSKAFDHCQQNVYGRCYLQCIKKHRNEQDDLVMCVNTCEGLLHACVVSKMEEMDVNMDADMQKRRLRFMRGCISKDEKCRDQCERKYGRQIEKWLACEERKCDKRFDLCAIEAEERFPDTELNQDELTKKEESRCAKTFLLARQRCADREEIFGDQTRCYDKAEREREACFTAIGNIVVDKVYAQEMKAKSRAREKCDKTQDVCAYKQCFKKGIKAGEALDTCIARRCDRNYMRCLRSAGLNRE